jgi:hypothetical protein
MATFEDNIRLKFAETADLVISKQKDYGSGNILNSPIDPKLAVLVRLNDKLQRFGNLLEKGRSASNESLQDTAKDIQGYGVILECLLDDTFDLPLQEELDELGIRPQ